MGLLYSKVKIFHFKEKINSLSEEVNEILPPIQIRIKPTNVCSHNCYYCAYRADNIQLGQDMDKKDYIFRDKMMEIIDDIVDMGVRAVTFSGGGDPFNYPYLLETIKKLNDTPVKFAALTNGARLDGELADIFSHNATWIRISIDGWDDESYSEYRKVKKGEFSRVLKNLKNFKKIPGKCYLGVCINVDKKNSSNVYVLIKKMNDIGVDSVKIAPCIVSNSGRKNNEYHKGIFNDVKKQIVKAKSEFSNQSFEIYDSYHEQLESFNKRYTWCPYLQVLPVIGADLGVYSCQDKAYNLQEGFIGSIKNIRFKDFWFSDKSRFFKINPAKVCNHHCVADAKNKLLHEYLNLEKKHLEFV